MVETIQQLSKEHNVQVKSWARQKNIINCPIPNISKIRSDINIIANNRDKALITLAYLTAGRISEILELKAGDISLIKEENRPVLLIDMPNRKHRKQKRKYIPIPLDTSEGDMANVITEYCKSLNPETLLFPSAWHGNLKPISEQWAWSICYKHLGFNPHYLRHIRLTHLATMYNFSDQLLIQFAGWSDSRPAKHYISLKWQDILKKM